MRNARCGSALLTISLLFLVGCGAAASTEDLPEDVNPPGSGADLRIESTGELDGIVRSDGTFDTGDSDTVAGDLDGTTNGLGVRTFYSFDLSGLRARATVGYAEVCFYQLGRVGTPYSTHGAAIFEHVDYGPALDASAYDVPTLFRLGGLVASNPNNPESGRCLNATALVNAALAAGDTRLQIRVRMEDLDSDADSVTDYVVWSCLDGPMSASSDTPHLRITY